ncbi:MAG: MBL fold metallo-hydrolase [Flavobacteriales bacterium]|nr:MBL fold metallo-hydrolase [Flavobacteriales bacterium]
MQITFLGTGTSQGVPVIACLCEVCASQDERDKRLRTSILISHEGKNVVIDSGPDFRQQMLRENVKMIEAVVFTHEHKDHVAGLDDVRAFNYFGRKTMDVYCTAQVEQAIRREFHYAFSESNYPAVPQLNLVRMEHQRFEIAGIPFQPIPVLHFGLPVLGFRMGRFTYITDANEIPASSKEKIMGSEILVLNALRTEKHPSHFNLDEALAVIQELKPATAWLTHISHQLGRHSDVEKKLPANVRLAYDGLKLEI